MRILALALLGSAVVLTMGCSSSRSFSRKAVMADHIASVRPDGSSYATTNNYVSADNAAPSTTVYARRAAPSTVTYTSAPAPTARALSSRHVPAPPPPPAMPGMSTTVRQPSTVTYVSRPAARPAVARPAARVASPARCAPRAAAKPKKAAGWKLFGCCPGGT